MTRPHRSRLPELVALSEDVYAAIINLALGHIDPEEPHGCEMIDAYVVVWVDEMLRTHLNLAEGDDDGIPF